MHLAACFAKVSISSVSLYNLNDTASFLMNFLRENLIKQFYSIAFHKWYLVIHPLMKYVILSTTVPTIMMLNFKTSRSEHQRAEVWGRSHFTAMNRCSETPHKHRVHCNSDLWYSKPRYSFLKFLSVEVTFFENVRGFLAWDHRCK